MCWIYSYNSVHIGFTGAYVACVIVCLYCPLCMLQCVYTAITLSKWDLLEQKRKEEEAAAAGKQATSGYDDIDGRSVGAFSMR